MVTLLTIWAYVKKYWAYAALVLAVVFGYLLFRRQNVDFSKQLKEIQDAHATELKQIQAARAEEEKQHQANEKQLQDALTAVQKQYDAAQKTLDASKKQEVADLVKKYGNDPQGLAQKLSESTGFKIILPTQ